MPDKPAARPARVTLSQVVEALLQRRPQDHSSVTLARNAKGETQIEVIVRSGSEGDVKTPTDALDLAVKLYDRARAKYPLLDGTTGKIGEGAKS